MKLCFPVVKNEGLDSTLYGHFASAPLFILIDTDTGESVSVPNCNKLDPEAGCDPFKALVNKKIDGVIVAGLGDGFLEMLNMMGARVYQAQSASVKESVELCCQDALEMLEMQNSAEAGLCDGVEESGGCDHSHDDEDGELIH